MFRAIFLLLSLSLFSAQSWSADPRIGILIFDGVLTSDVTAPAEVFGVASKKAWFKDYKVSFISVKNQAKVTTEEGLVLTPDFHIGIAPELDVLIVPSAYEMKPLLNNNQLKEFLIKQSEKVKWLSSNCSGAFLLANAGLLDGFRATTWAGGEKELQGDFDKVKVVHDQNVVVDGNRITSNGSVVSYQSAILILLQMSSEKNAQEVFESLQMERLMNWTDLVKHLK